MENGDAALNGEGTSDVITSDALAVALPVNIDEDVIFRPEGSDVSYILRHWTQDMRHTLSERLVGMCGYAVGMDELHEAIRDGVEEMSTDETREEQTAFVDHMIRVSTEPSPETGETDDDRAAMDKRWDKLRRRLSRCFAPYRELLEQSQRWQNTYGTLAVQLALRGWDGLQGDFRLVQDFVSPETFKQIPADDLQQIAAKVVAMQSLTRKQRKN